MKNNKRIPIIEDQMNLVFLHLYDDNFGVIAKMSGIPDLIMIMPSDKGFIPELGKSYSCSVSLTRFGRFTYNKRTYRLAIGVRSELGSIFDEINYECDFGPGQKKERFSNNPFENLSDLFNRKEENGNDA